MTRFLVSVIILILTAATFTPSAVFAYSDDNTTTPYGKSIVPVKSQTDLKVPANAVEDTSISGITLILVKQ